MPRARTAVSGTWYALGAIALWATLASFGVALAHVPPFLLTGLALSSAACRRGRWRASGA